ncbi:MAG: endonuclease, partial [Ferruginibacter sp.]
MYKKKCFFAFIFPLFFYHTNAQSLKLITYNIRLDVAVDGENDWTHRKAFLASQIVFYAPDIFGVQEATPNEMVDLDSMLQTYSHIGNGREGIGKGEASAIFYNKSKFKIKNETTFWLSETPNVMSKGWDASYLRVCTYALFTDIKNKKTFWVFNTHLDHM